jgi:hypothetical protein
MTVKGLLSWLAPLAASTVGELSVQYLSKRFEAIQRAVCEAEEKLRTTMDALAKASHGLATVMHQREELQADIAELTRTVKSKADHLARMGAYELRLADSINGMEKTVVAFGGNLPGPHPDAPMSASGLKTHAEVKAANDAGVFGMPYDDAVKKLSEGSPDDDVDREPRWVPEPTGAYDGLPAPRTMKYSEPDLTNDAEVIDALDRSAVTVRPL